MANPYVSLGAAQGAASISQSLAPQAQADRAKARQQTQEAKLATYQSEQSLAQAQKPEQQEFDANAFKLLQEQQQKTMQAAGQDIFGNAMNVYAETRDPAVLNAMKKRLVNLNGGKEWEDIVTFQKLSEDDRASLVAQGRDADQILASKNHDFVRVIRKDGSAVAVPLEPLKAMMGYGGYAAKAERARRAAAIDEQTKYFGMLSSAGKEAAQGSLGDGLAVGTPEFSADVARRTQAGKDAEAAAKIRAANVKYAQDQSLEVVKAMNKPARQDNTLRTKLANTMASIGDKLAGIGVDLATTQFDDPKVRQLIDTDMAALTKEAGQQLVGAQLKTYQELTKVTGLLGIASGMPKSNTRVIDSFFHKAMTKFSEGVIEGTEEETAFAVVRTAIAHSLFGASQTIGELKSFEKVLGTTSNGLGTLLIQMKAQLVQAQFSIAGMKVNRMDVLNRYTFGGLEEKTQKVISGLEDRIEAIKMMQDGGMSAEHVFELQEAKRQAAEIATNKSQAGVGTTQVSTEQASALDSILGF